MRPTAQRAVSRRRLIAKGIFSMSGPLSLLVRSVISSGSSCPICFITRYGPTSRSTEIWTFLEDDVRCAAWFNSGYTLTRQSTFPPAVNCSAFAPRSSGKFGCPVRCDAHVWSFNGKALMRQSMEVVISHVFPREGGPRIPRSVPGAVHTWKSGHHFHGPVYLAVTCSVFGCCLRSAGKLDFSGR